MSDKKVSNRVKAFEMFEQGATDQMVGCVLGLSENTVRAYRTKYKKSLNQETTIDTKQVKSEPKSEVATNPDDVYVPDTICMIIGKDIYDIKYYIDVRDGSNWFDYMQLISILKTENIIPPTGYNPNIADRYFRDERLNGTPITLIDKHILMEFAQNIGDYTFLNAVMGLYTSGVKDVFFKFSQIMDAFKMIENLTSNDNIDKKIDEVKAFNTGQLDFLHKELDNDPFATEEELLDKMKRLKTLRSARRSVKNELVLAQTLRSSMRYYKFNCGAVYNIRQRVSKLIDDLYARKYNSRLDNLDDWQKEIVDKIIDAEFQLEEAN